MLAFNIVSLAAVPWLALTWPTAALSVLMVGFTVAIGTALQTRLMDVAADGQTLAATLNHAANCQSVARESLLPNSRTPDPCLQGFFMGYEPETGHARGHAGPQALQLTPTGIRASGTAA